MVWRFIRNFYEIYDEKPLFSLSKGLFWQFKIMFWKTRSISENWSTLTWFFSSHPDLLWPTRQHSITYKLLESKILRSDRMIQVVQCISSSIIFKRPWVSVISLLNTWTWLSIHALWFWNQVHQPPPSSYQPTPHMSCVPDQTWPISNRQLVNSFRTFLCYI